MSNRNPEERSAAHPPVTPDQPAAHATGAEVTKEVARLAPQSDETPVGVDLDAFAKAQELATEYYAKLSDLTVSFGEQVGTYYGRSRGAVGDNPLPSLSGAFVVGIVIGTILGRR